MLNSPYRLLMKKAERAKPRKGLLSPFSILADYCNL